MTLDPKLELLIILFAISVVVWLALIIYRGRLAREEEDQVFLGTTPERLTEKDRAIMKRVARLSTPIWIVGVLMVLLLLASICLWVYQGLMA
ncbi:MAG TPA: hypothetical protein VGS20_13525 [Candidatus Acidoferrales bacterium]|nr:hypothetical protein [Candidatus Acidoferrales bacterium]